MSISRIEKVYNGDFLVDFVYYKCDITGVEFPEGWGWYGNDHIHISEEGIEILFEEWLDSKDKFCIPLVLSYMEGRFCQRIKPNRYISKELKKEVLDKYVNCCNECGSSERLEIDHIIPVSKKGLSELSNLQVLCKTCNLKKGNKIVNHFK